MNKLPLCPCDSSQIHGYGYVPETRTMVLQFKSKGQPGPKYTYADVSPEAYAAFVKAESKGKHFGSAIRGKFAHTKLADPEEKSA